MDFGADADNDGGSLVGVITLQMVLALEQAIDPKLASTKPAQNVAAAIVAAVDPEHPIFGDAIEDAAVLAEVAYEESHWQPKKTRIGSNDNGLARCEYQLHSAPLRVEWDLDACTALAYQRIRASAQTCPAAPLSWYVSGGCANKAGLRISRQRMATAKRVAALVRSDDSEQLASKGLQPE